MQIYSGIIIRETERAPSKMYFSRGNNGQAFSIDFQRSVAHNVSNIQNTP